MVGRYASIAYSSMNHVTLWLVLLPAVLHAAESSEDKSTIVDDSVFHESNLKNADLQESLPNFADPEIRQKSEVEGSEKKEGEMIHIIPYRIEFKCFCISEGYYTDSCL